MRIKLPNARAIQAVLLVLALILGGVIGVPASEKPAVKVPVTPPTGRTLFDYYLYPLGGGKGGRNGEVSTGWDLTAPQNKPIVDAIVDAGLSWTDVLGPGAANSAPVRINVWSVGNYHNATASSNGIEDGPYAGFTEMAAQLIHDYNPQNPGNPLNTRAYIDLGDWYFYNRSKDPMAIYYNGPVTHLPRNGDQVHLAACMYHEIGHALGIISPFYQILPNGVITFGDSLSVFVQNLRDQNGKPAQPNQLVVGNTQTYLQADGSLDYRQMEREINRLWQNAIATGDEQDAAYYEKVINEWGKLTATEPFMAPYVRDGRGAIQHVAGEVPVMYFRGKNVLEVLGADSPGLDMWTWETDYQTPMPVPPEDGTVLPAGADFSHLDPYQSLMSHQTYSNFASFMEAELAVMQDLGYQIDRKNFYGQTIVGEKQTIVNHNGYSARNAAGTAYLPGQYNPTAIGVGLHVYADQTDVAQAADLLTVGFAALGIRNDGNQNTIRVNPGVRVHSNGQDGIGLAIAYGSGNRVVHQGDIQATGPGGIGVSFDFGSNNCADVAEFRGSYMWSKAKPGADGVIPGAWVDGKYMGDWQLYENIKNDPGPYRVYEDLASAMVDSFDLSGTIAGAGKAIYISENAHVENINVLNGAGIAGDIVSDWKPAQYQRVGADYVRQSSDAFSSKFILQHDDPGSLYTNLTFGRKANSEGEATGLADPAFQAIHIGDIHGGHSLALSVEGGTLTRIGNTGGISLTVQRGATLASQGDFLLSGLAGSFFTTTADPTGRAYVADGFVNHGTWDLDNGGLEVSTVQLGGASTFVSDGAIQVNFNRQNQHDQIAFASIPGEAPLAPARVNVAAGSLLLAPVKDYYQTGTSTSVDLNDLILLNGVADPTLSTAFKTTAATGGKSLLSFGRVTNNNGVATFAATRRNGIYADLADNNGAAELGYELERLAATSLAGSRTGANLRSVITDLDFGFDPGLAASTLNALLPGFYNTSARAVMDSQRLASATLLNGHLLPSYRSPEASRRIRGTFCEEHAAATSCDDDSGLYLFASALGGGGRQGDRGQTAGYHFGQGGFMLGLERRQDGSTLGVHLLGNYLKMDGNSSASALKSTGGYLGVHGNLAPNAWHGAYLFGLARAGFDHNRQDREVRLPGGRGGVSRSSWTGGSGNAILGFGFDYVTDCFRIGPMAAVDWAFAHRPGVTESDGFAPLALAAETYHSLRSVLGLRYSGWLTEKATLNATAGWNHEFLNSAGATRAGFAGLSQSDRAFSRRYEVEGRDSLAATLGVEYKLNARTSLGLEAGGEFFRKGYASGWGKVSVSVGF